MGNIVKYRLGNFNFAVQNKVYLGNVTHHPTQEDKAAWYNKNERKMRNTFHFKNNNIK